MRGGETATECLSETPLKTLTSRKNRCAALPFPVALILSQIERIRPVLLVRDSCDMSARAAESSHE